MESSDHSWHHSSLGVGPRGHTWTRISARLQPKTLRAYLGRSPQKRSPQKQVSFPDLPHSVVQPAALFPAANHPTASLAIWSSRLEKWQNQGLRVTSGNSKGVLMCVRSGGGVCQHEASRCTSVQACVSNSLWPLAMLKWI